MKAAFHALLGALLLTTAIRAQTTFDPVAEFSIASNPGGAWSYGMAAGIGSFALFPKHGMQGELDVWNRDSSSVDLNLPIIYKNNSGHIVTGGGGNVYQPNQLILHPGNTPADQFVVVRFTAPTSGVYTVTAQFVGLFNTGDGTSSDAHVAINGLEVFGANVRGYANEVSFSLPVPVTLRRGSTIDFLVGNGGNGYVGDSTGLAATVTLIRPAIAAEIFPAVEVGWDSEVGVRYQLQSTLDLLINEWVNVGGQIVGTGGFMTAFDSTRNRVQKFYRIVQVQ